GKARGKTAPVRRNERRIRGTESVLGRIRRLRSPAGARAEQRVSGIDRELYRARARVSCAARAKQGRSPGVLRRGTRARETGEGRARRAPRQAGSLAERQHDVLLVRRALLQPLVVRVDPG